MSEAGNRNASQSESINPVLIDGDAVLEINKIKSEAKEKMLCQIKDFYRNFKYSDLIIKCGGVDLPVHKLVVCPQSEVFEAALSHDMQEKKTGVIDLDDEEMPVECEIAHAMIQFLYTQDYDFILDTDGPKIPHLVLEIKLFCLADKYLVHALKKFVDAKFRSHAKVADEEGILAAAETISTRRFGNSDGLRQTIADVIQVNDKRLIEYAKKPGVKLDEPLGICFELMNSYVNALNVVNMKCSRCKRSWNWVGLNVGTLPMLIACRFCRAQLLYGRNPISVSSHSTAVNAPVTGPYAELFNSANPSSVPFTRPSE